jgi:hypothetical protein
MLSTRRAARGTTSIAVHADATTARGHRLRIGLERPARHVEHLKGAKMSFVYVACQ